MLDKLFVGASVIDGTGSPARVMDVGVKDGKITLETKDETAEKVIDGRGKILCPGFIDSHSHGDMSIASVHGPLCKISQGVTTEVGGQCGQSAFPVDRRYLREVQGIMAFSPDFNSLPYETFKSFREYKEYGDNLKLPIHICSLVGHNTLRVSVMGVEDRDPGPEEMELMKERLRESMEAGAMGLSSGLIYIPGVYCRTEEVIELCKVIKPYGGIYATHMRNEAEEVVEAVKEAIYIAEQAEVPLVISHHKICGKRNWGLSSETLRLIDEAASRGTKVMIDQYPYEAPMTALNVCIPPQYFSEGLPALLEKIEDPLWRGRFMREMSDPEGDYDNFYLNSGGFTGIMVASSPNVPEAEGMTIAEYGEKIHKTASDAYFDLLIANKGGGEGIYFAIDINEVEKIYCHPRTMAGSDGLCSGLGRSGHPRAWGTFVRPLREFVKEKKLMPLEEAIRKQTGLTADTWNLRGKGYIREGYDADLVLIDFETLYDRADYKNSNEKADGIEAVYVMGELTYGGKELTGAANGKIICRGL